MFWRWGCDTCGKTIIQETTPSEEDRFCNCVPKKLMVGKPYSTGVPPISDELQTVLSISNAAKLRGELCTSWGISNKSHRQHGSNFSGNQTL